MPIFMDLHIGQGLTAEDVAMAHQADLRFQGQFKCKCLTYWVDEARGSAYCLIDAPNKETVFKLHETSHKQLPDEIIQVDPRVVKAFLGRTHDPEVVDYLIDQKIKVFNDPAFRVILMVKTKNESILEHEIGKLKAKELVSKNNQIIKKCIEKHKGVASEKQGEEMVASFDSLINVPLCAIDIENYLKSVASLIDLQVIIHAGQPVDDSSDLFGNTLMLMRLLKHIEQKKRILVSALVSNLLKEANYRSALEANNISHLSLTEEQFLIALSQTIHYNCQNANFNQDDFIKDMSLSKSKLYRQCIEITGMSPSRLLNKFRLTNALVMLKNTNKTVAEIAFDTGFNSPSYFSKCFHKRFGIQPSNLSHS
ncbi:nickel-binding protein [Flavobacteriaceae bacterium LMO-SS05]